MTTPIIESEMFKNYQGYIQHHASLISSRRSNQFGAFSKEDLISAGNAQLAIFIDNGSLDKLNEGTIKLRLRGAMIDELRKFSNYNRYSKSTPIPVDEAIVIDCISFSTNEVLPSGIDFNEFVNGLTKQEQWILKMHYLESIEFTMIAKKLNVTISRISQIHSSAVKKLRKKISAEIKLWG
jgi:RNA polymerase sigma factor (sigma-70 family)